MTTRAYIARGHRVFRAALEAMARPGRPIPVADIEDGLLGALFEAVFEPDTPTHAVGAPAFGRAAAPGVPLVDGGVPTLGRPAAPEHARVLLVNGGRSHGALLRLPRGTELEPELGATAVYRAGNGDHTRVRLAGPGVQAPATVTLPLHPDELADRALACAAPPLGIDLLIVRDGAFTGVPRSTTVEA